MRLLPRYRQVCSHRLKDHLLTRGSCQGELFWVLRMCFSLQWYVGPRRHVGEPLSYCDMAILPTMYAVGCSGGA